ncbi:MAG: hypothetical protein R6T96_05840 [Longimicrobiales bacterium]
MSKPLTSDEERLLRAALRRGDAPLCPRCGQVMDVTEVKPRQEVAYVRRRAVLQCPRCGARGVVDRK